MRKATIYYKNEKSGILTELNDSSFTFEYLETWLMNDNKPAISLTMTKTKAPFISQYMMAFFYNMLPEGANKKVLCTNLKIDEKDYFSLLCAATRQDTVGAITVEQIEIENETDYNT